ncbi:hypothetical protein Strain138_000593 [Pseudogemmatithrix spongiicola]|uniref:Uncharacterized protein n=1 Tax=Pseudogemmatithrix spongiicola TaxID=3062599 RepID=A0AA49JSS0_9BACT|nr:hypothetical protein Strain138_000593 [Gemmatimonadaceae bacterium 'strain 138']WKW14260.1 hypothetical protein Strain318_000593 [Gemmatimonadaceae bacterium 'strain 318']
MIGSRWRRGLALGAAVALIGSCAEPTAPQRPVAGALQVTWTTPHVDDRSALLRVVLPSGLSATGLDGATPGIEVFHRQSGDTLFIAAFGELASGALLRFEVPDVRQASRIAATIVEVGAADDALRTTTDGYAVRVQQP